VVRLRKENKQLPWRRHGGLNDADRKGVGGWDEAELRGTDKLLPRLGVGNCLAGPVLKRYLGKKGERGRKKKNRPKLHHAVFSGTWLLPKAKVKETVVGTSSAGESEDAGSLRTGLFEGEKRRASLEGGTLQGYWGS